MRDGRLDNKHVTDNIINRGYILLPADEGLC